MNDRVKTNKNYFSTQTVWLRGTETQPLTVGLIN